MKTLVESVIKFNGRIIYGCNSNNETHDQSLVFKKRSGAYATRGQVAIKFDSDGNITEAKLFKNKFLATEHIISTTKSNGIMR